ncbi:hypothetical protein SOVF_105150 [Spinacia oleracea]|uniref:Transcription termination factor MTERF2, chloroplastic n=1 Tax=Spinacia oleracea TaxID=3562 RepID=A0ABM3QGF5_SPIOL|nr:transcription termination factor MTERF2, chloroplastic-like [Spinacia oleracea]KNA14713.1 hypothetical protein SOVF_105150 [Spinacia oleracea]
MLKFGSFCNHDVRALYFIHGFCHRLLSTSPSSSSKSLQPLQILTNLGFQKKKSLSSTKLYRYLEAQEVKKVSNSDFAENVDSVVDFFKQIGFEQSQIKKVISYDPRLLSANVDKTLKPKVKVLQDLGFSGSDVVHAILANPLILNRRLNPAIDALREVLGSDYNVVRILKQSKWISFAAAAKHLVPNVKLLQNYGISNDKITKYMLQQPRVLVRKTDIFQDMLITVEEKFCIPRDSSSFLPGIYLACFKEESFEGKCDIFKSFGWAHSDVLTLIRQNPYCLGLSEARITKKLNFLMKELSYEPAYVAAHNQMMSYSLEKRVIPRYKMLVFLKEKRLLTRDYSFYTVACWSEPKFLKKLVEPFKDVIPDIHQVYLSTRDVVPLTQGRADTL